MLGDERNGGIMVGGKRMDKGEESGMMKNEMGKGNIGMMMTGLGGMGWERVREIGGKRNWMNE